MRILFLFINLQKVYFIKFFIQQYTSDSFKEFVQFFDEDEEEDIYDIKNIAITEKSGKKPKKYDEINELKRLLLDERKLSKKLTKDNQDLNVIIDKLKNENNEIKKLLKNDIINQLKEKIKFLENEILKKNKEIQNYISQLKNVNEKNSENNSVKPEENNFSLIFNTQGNQDIINYKIQCKSTELFVRLEERLYNEFPKYRNYETFFIDKNRKILRFKTLEENKIINNDVISLFYDEKTKID